MKYIIEDPIENKEVIERLSRQCWDEVDQLKDFGIDLDIDWDQYKTLNDLGQLRYYSILSDQEEKVGFAVFLIIRSLHCKGLFIAMSDVMYIQPAYRTYGAEFLKLIQQDLKEEGVNVFSFNVKSWLDSGKLAKKLGCELYEYVYQKRL